MRQRKSGHLRGIFSHPTESESGEEDEPSESEDDDSNMTIQLPVGRYLSPNGSSTPPSQTSLDGSSERQVHRLVMLAKHPDLHDLPPPPKTPPSLSRSSSITSVKGQPNVTFQDATSEITDSDEGDVSMANDSSKMSFASDQSTASSEQEPERVSVFFQEASPPPLASAKIYSWMPPFRSQPTDSSVSKQSLNQSVASDKTRKASNISPRSDNDVSRATCCLPKRWQRVLVLTLTAILILALIVTIVAALGINSRRHPSRLESPETRNPETPTPDLNTSLQTDRPTVAPTTHIATNFAAPEASVQATHVPTQDTLPANTSQPSSRPTTSQPSSLLISAQPSSLKITPQPTSLKITPRPSLRATSSPSMPPTRPPTLSPTKSPSSFPIDHLLRHGLARHKPR